ncbi:MAG: hypothetical protein HY319_02985 [Armatimonadetes bacterium]|nr:hypothetical protein [Armatimonadota bacterium]
MARAWMLVWIFGLAGTGCWADVPGSDLAAQTESLVRAEPTGPETVLRRHYQLRSLALLIVSECGTNCVDPVLSPEGMAGIEKRLEAGELEEAAHRIDRALLGLCRVARERQAGPLLSKRRSAGWNATSSRGKGPRRTDRSSSRAFDQTLA